MKQLPIREEELTGGKRDICGHADDQEKQPAGRTGQPSCQVSETWAQDIIEDLDDYIEAQGIYLRQ